MWATFIFIKLPKVCKQSPNGRKPFNLDTLFAMFCLDMCQNEALVATIEILDLEQVCCKHFGQKTL
jgi:hypothetical protein